LEAFEAAKINNVAFQVISNCNNSFTEKVFTNNVKAIYSYDRTEPRTKKWKTEKLESRKTDMLRSIGKQSGESVESVLKKKGKGCGGNDSQKRKILSLE